MIRIHLLIGCMPLAFWNKQKEILLKKFNYRDWMTKKAKSSFEIEQLGFSQLRGTVWMGAMVIQVMVIA